MSDSTAHTASGNEDFAALVNEDGSSRTLHWRDVTANDLPASLGLDLNHTGDGTSDGADDTLQWEKLWKALEKCDAEEVLGVDTEPGDDNEGGQDSDSTKGTQPPSQPLVQPRGPISTAITAVAFVGTVVMWIIDQAWDAKQRREQFTRTTVSKMRENDRRFNYVICCTRHEYRFDGRRGIDWAHERTSVPTWWGFSRVNYDVYAFRGGMFRLLGDGGYINWAYIGNRINDTGGRPPRTVTFRAPP